MSIKQKAGQTALITLLLTALYKHKWIDYGMRLGTWLGFAMPEKNVPADAVSGMIYNLRKKNKNDLNIIVEAKQKDN